MMRRYYIITYAHFQNWHWLFLHIILVKMKYELITTIQYPLMDFPSPVKHNDGCWFQSCIDDQYILWVPPRIYPYLGIVILPVSVLSKVLTPYQQNTGSVDAALERHLVVYLGLTYILVYNVLTYWDYFYSMKSNISLNNVYRAKF